MKGSYTTIRVRKETLEKLREAGRKGETYDDVINKLLLKPAVEESATVKAKRSLSLQT